MRKHLPGKTRALSVLRRPSSNSRCSPPRHTRSWRPRHGVSSSAESLTLANTSFGATNAGGREHWSAAPPARAGHLLSLFRPALTPLVSSTLRLVPLWTLTDFCAWSPSSIRVSSSGCRCSLRAPVSHLLLLQAPPVTITAPRCSSQNLSTSLDSSLSLAPHLVDPLLLAASTDIAPGQADCPSATPSF